jgi:flagellin-like protein
LNKKAISPLIATVLIVGFTILLAVIVVNWAQQITEGVTSEVSCESAASSLCRRMPDIPITISKYTIGFATRVVISNVYSRDLEYLIVVKSNESTVVQSEIINVTKGSIFDTNIINSLLFVNTYYPGYTFQFTALLPHTEDNIDCKATCKTEEFTIK